jgi:hypothetical protein
LEALKALLRFFSYLVHLVLALFLLATSGLALVSGTHNLQLGMLPWTGPALTYAVFFGALAALVTIALAVFDRARWPFCLWNLVVIVLIVKGYIFSSYHFASGEAPKALSLTLACVVALLGSWFVMWRTPERRY